MSARVRLGLAVVLLTAAACASAPRGRGDVDASAEQRRDAALALDARDYQAAIHALEPLSREFPKDADVWTMLGDAYRGAGDFDRSVSSYEQAIRVEYGDYVPHLKLGVLLMEHQKTGRALTELEVAVKYSARDPLTNYNYGLALHETGRGQEALEQWRLAREIDPHNAAFVEAVGIGLTGVDDSAAVECFQEAESLGQRGPSFENNYALALERVGENDAAEKRFRAAVAASAGDRREEEYRSNLALHCLRVGKYEESAKEFEALIRANGEKWSYAVYLARTRLALGRFDAAIAGLEGFALDVEAGKVDRASGRIDRMPPTLGEALDLLGMAWRGRGDKERARDYLRRAVALEPKDPTRLNNYGVVLAESGMLPDARAQWQRVLEIDPENATAKANLAAFGP